MKRRRFFVTAASAGAAGFAGNADARKPVIAARTLNREYIRVGMVGTGPYSHAAPYIQAINTPVVPPRTPMKVVAVWGRDDHYRGLFRGTDAFVAARTAAIADAHDPEMYRRTLGVETIVKNPGDMVPLVDAAFIMDPQDALALARPFIEAKKPLFLNRPAAWSLAEITEIVRLAEASGVPIMSGSCVPWMNEFRAARSRIDAGKVQHWYADGSTANLVSYLPHILETALAVAGGRVARCSTHGMSWRADEDPLATPPVSVHVEYEPFEPGRAPAIGVASTWYGAPYRNWMKVHMDDDVLEEGVVWEGASGLELDDHLWLPLLRQVAQMFETWVAPETGDDIIHKTAVMLMAHKSGARGGMPVGMADIGDWELPRWVTEKA